MKPVKRSVSLVIERKHDIGVLLVKRPDDDESLPGIWGLPAVSLRTGETEQEAVRRAGKEKLGVVVDPVRLIGEAKADRGDYELVMRDYRVEVLSGELSVPQPFDGTQYVAWKWGRPDELVPGARQGSLCSQVLLAERGIDW